MGKTEGIILTIALYLLLVCAWAIIIPIILITFIFNNLTNYFCGGLFNYVYITIYISAIVLPIVFWKKLRGSWTKPAALLCAAIIACLCHFGIECALRGYVSEFDKHRWDTDMELRYYMIEDIEKDYKIIGMSENEVTELLGDAQFKSGTENDKVLEYFISSGFIDPITYDITVKDGIVVDAEMVIH